MIQKFLLFIFIFTSFSSVNHSHAGALAGALEPTQMLNNFELIGVNISSGSTAFNTHVDMIKNTVADPIANGIINAMLQTTANSVISWAKNGFSGNSPVIIDDPEKYLTKVGLDAVNKALTSIPEDGIYSDSIFSAIRNSNIEKSLAEELAELSGSNIPALVQENSCNDEAITKMAESRVYSFYAESEVTEADIAEQKEILWANLCEGDINDPDVAKNLVELNSQDPSLSGWEGFLSIAEDNAYVKSTQGAIKAENDKTTKQELKKFDMFDGLNALTETGCELEEDLAGNTYCKDGSEKTITPSDTINNALNLASTAGLQRLFNISGAGSLTSILTEFATQALAKGLSEGIASLRDGGGGSSETIGSSAPYTNDLANRPKEKEGLITTMQRDFEMYENTLLEFESLVGNYSASMTSYESKLSNMMACYNSLQNRGPEYQTAQNLYSTRMTTINDIKTVLESDTRGIAQARAILEDKKAKINASNSSQEIGDLYMAYQSEITRPGLGLPNFETVAKRKGEYTTNKSNAERDEEPDKLIQKCNELKASEGTASSGSGNAIGGAEGGE